MKEIYIQIDVRGRPVRAFATIGAVGAAFPAPLDIGPTGHGILTTRPEFTDAVITNPEGYVVARIVSVPLEAL